MIWVYVFATTTGIMLIVPTWLQAIDRRDAPQTQPSSGGSDGSARRGTTMFEFFAFVLTMFGLSGTLMTQFDPGRLTALIAALSLGLAAGAVHPEVLASVAQLRQRA